MNKKKVYKCYEDFDCKMGYPHENNQCCYYCKSKKICEARCTFTLEDATEKDIKKCKFSLES